MALAATTILRWIETRLKSDSALVALIGGATPRIVSEEAAKGIIFPYVLISPLDPARPEYAVGVRAIAHAGIYLVRGVHATKSYGPPLETIAERIIAVLHGERGIADHANGISSSYLEAAFSLTEPRDSEQYRHLGGRFRITANA